jgi:hypothetical protein
MKGFRFGLSSCVLGLAMAVGGSVTGADLYENFNAGDLSTNTPVTLEFFNSDPGLNFGVQAAGGNAGVDPMGNPVPAGGMFQVTEDGINDNRNYAYFDRTAEGAYETINFNFDLRIGPQDASADGGSISFMSTQVFGATGGVAQSLFGVPEDPSQVGVLGIGFDTWSNTDVGDQENSGASDSIYNDVTLYYNSSVINQYVNPNPAMRDRLPNGIIIDDDAWHSVAGTFDFVNQTASMTIDGMEVWNDLPVPGLVPYESRVMLGARTGGENENFQIDNLDIRYVGPTESGEVDPVQPAPTAGNWSIREWKPFGVTVSGTAGADAVIADPDLLIPQFVKDGQSPIINHADPQAPGGGYSVAIAKTPFLTNTSGDDNDIVMRAIAKVIIPETGQYTFGIDGDDGTRLTVAGASFTHQAGGGTATGERVEFANDTGDAFTLGSTMLTAGEHDIELVWNERGGGAFVEVFAAPGVKTALDNDFAPIGQREEINVAEGTLPTTVGQWTVRNVDVVGSRPLNNLADAQAAIDLDDLDPDVSFADTVMADVVNYNDPDTNGAGAGRFTPDDFFPVDLPGTDDDDFATMATVVVSIEEENDYIFGFGSDDGASLTLEGADFTILSNQPQSMVTNDGQTIEFNANTGNSDTFATTHLMPGEYELTFLSWERGGGAWAEVYTGVGSIPESILTARLLGSPAEEFDIVIPRGLQLGGEGGGGGIPGDYNGNGTVEQADLDLVLLNWGGSTVPGGWVNNLPEGNIDQAELDGVLLNWGNTGALGSGGGAGVPEPGTLVLLAVAAGLGLGLVRRK